MADEKTSKEFLLQEQPDGSYNLLLKQTMSVRDFGIAWGNFSSMFIELIKNNNSPEVIAETKSAMLAHLEAIWMGKGSMIEINPKKEP
jgi:hypothetical protein